MKRLLIILLGALLLTACGNGADKEYTDQLKEAEKNLEEAKEDLKRTEEISKQIDETSDLLKETLDQMEDADYIGDLSQDELNELFEFNAMGLDDVLVELVIDNGEIKGIVEVADHKNIDDKKILAELIYSRAGDAFMRVGMY